VLGSNGHDELGTGNPDLQDSYVPVDVSDLGSPSPVVATSNAEARREPSATGRTTSG
jgi:hypothetical protein